MLSNNNPARGHHLSEDVGSKFPLGCSEATRTEILSPVSCWAVPLKAIPTQPPMKAKTIEFRFFGMRVTPEVTGPTPFPFSKKYRTQQVLHICYAIDMQHKFRVRVGAGKKTCLRSLVVGLRGDRLVARLNADIGGPLASSRAPRCSQAHEAIDLVVMFRGRDRARANSGKCGLYSSRAVIVARGCSTRGGG
jgi:hypothetical protein